MPLNDPTLRLRARPRRGWHCPGDCPRPDSADAASGRHSRTPIASIVVGFALAAAAACASETDLVEAASESLTEAHARGLLASALFDGQPMKGVYFFPGDVGDYNRSLYTAHPTLPEDAQWNSDASARASIIDRVIATHANTLIMSYWGDEMTQWSPMAVDENSIRNVVETVAGKALVIIPALESGFDAAKPDTPHWRFSEDFPFKNGVYDPSALAPSLIARVHRLVQIFSEHRDSWAQLYDRQGRARYAIHILHAGALKVPAVSGKTADQVVAEALDDVAREIARSDGIEIGFTLDAVSGEAVAYEFAPDRAGPALMPSDATLAIQGFISEIYTGALVQGAPNADPYDNNVDNLANLVAAKRAELQRWYRSGLPVILDVSSGFDGRFVWRSLGSSFWGDNLDYTSSDWRNALSALKGEGYVGVTFNTWNGYTEGYAAVPTEEHGDAIYRWLEDLYGFDSRACHHVDYLKDVRSYVVEGTTCTKWRELAAGLGALGAPSSEASGAEVARRQHFAGGSVFATTAGTYEVHGAIAAQYKAVGYDTSCLGLPVSDEESFGTGLRSRFEHGEIVLSNGQATQRCR
jgi:hypothetical protein